MDFAKILGKNLKKIRLEKGFTQEQIAKILGITSKSVKNYESGKREIPMDKLHNLIAAYGLDLNQFTYVEDEEDGKLKYHVPFLGKIQCGLPIFAQENIEDYKLLPIEYKEKGTFFYLTAQGDSMIDLSINDGDWLLMKKTSALKKGEVGGFLFKDSSEVNLKIYMPDLNNDKVILQSANKKYDDIVIEGEELNNLVIFAKLERVEKRHYSLESLKGML